MRHVRENHSLAGDREITLEGNPDNFQGDKAARAASLGFNRFSIGVQSLDDRVTRFVGRRHNPTDISSHLNNMESGWGIPLSHGRQVTGRQAASVALGYAFKACKPISVPGFKERFQVDLLKGDPYREPVTQPGTYDVYISAGLRDGTPQLALPLADDDGQRRYKICRVTLLSAD